MENDSKDAMDFRTFCKRNSISLSFLYELLKTGNGPAVIAIGRRRLISANAASEWRKRFEKAA